MTRTNPSSLGRGLAGLMRACACCFSSNPAMRRHGRYQLLSFFAIRMDLRVYNHSAPWHWNETVNAAWKAFPGRAGRLSDRHFNLYQFARAAAALPGDTAECGVFRGAGSHMILSAMTGAGKTHHIFDSFEGLSAPEARDKTDSEIAFVWEPNDLQVSEEEVQHNLSPFPGVQYHKGWIPTCFPQVENRNFCLVHIDVDLYLPTFDAIAFFYPRMVAGGVIVCDDYGFKTCPGAHAAVNDFMRNKPEGVVHLTSGQGFITKLAEPLQ